MLGVYKCRITSCTQFITDAKSDSFFQQQKNLRRMFFLSNMEASFFVITLAVCFAHALGRNAGQPPSSCSVIINELQLATPTVLQEFIELSTDCPLPLDLRPYTLALWSSRSASAIVLKNLAHFAKTTNCTTLTRGLLVIGSPATVLPDASDEGQFCSFDDFGGDWSRGQNGYIDKGNGKTNALVLYR